MENTNNNLSAPKTVSADTKITMQVVNNKKSFALPFEPKSLEDLRRIVNRYPEESPCTLFYCLLCKGVCPPKMLKEMLGLNDALLPVVFNEIGDVNCDANVRWILENNLLLDENGKYVSVSLSPAQQKLRKLLLKIVIAVRFVQLIEDLEDEFGIELYDEYDEVLKENTISEEELLDALQTYQAEHRA